MRESHNEETVTFYDLNWDTEFFGVKSAKAILHRPLTLSKWIELEEKFKDYQFISIENRDSEPVNAQLIGKDTSAFLVDVNIQFVKKIEKLNELPKNISFHQALKRNDQILEIADFQFSKFTEDPNLANRDGDKVYYQWLNNSFDKPDKYFVLSNDGNDNINGFLLYSYSNDACVIELIAVSQAVKNSGIGSNLFNGVERSAIERGYNQIKVGTQMRNLKAINFYNKMGCKQVGCHQVFHLWNL